MRLIITLLSALASVLTINAKTGREIIKDNGFRSEVQPMLTTQWSQDGGENSLLPLVNGHLAKTGCGATATAQVMKYWSFPQNGIRKNYYIWDSPQKERIVLHCDFENEPYDWDNMIARYKNNPNATEQQIKAVSLLMAHLGIALEMKYQDSGTATNIEYISTVLKKYYQYNPGMTIHRYAGGAYTMDEWLTMLYKELSEGRPVIMGGAYNGANHIYVADGYDTDGRIHLNLGKASIGSSCNIDGYYDLTVTGQTYNEDMRMLIGITPEHLPCDIPVFNVKTAGTLKEVLGTDSDSKKLCMIKLKGEINTEDIQWLRTLSAAGSGQLSYIDLAEVNISGNRLPSNAFDNSYVLQQIILPENLEEIGSEAFRNCTGLWKIWIPLALKSIRDYAFSNCRYLEGLDLPQALQTVGVNPFRYDKVGYITMPDDNKKFIVYNGALLDKTGTELYSMPTLTVGEYKLKDGVKEIKPQAFLKQCMIRTLHLPMSVVRIRSNAFLECVGLKDIYVYAVTPPDVFTNSFDTNILATCTLHVPVGTKSAYQASQWSMFDNICDDIKEEALTQIMSDGPSLSDSDELYDLNGRRVTNPTSGTFYIVKGTTGLGRKIIYK